MPTTDTLVIGAGQAGLAMSRCLTDRGVDHVVLERGRVAERWRSERWDSLRLLTPNWMSRLPGWSYAGPDPDGFMTAAEVVAYFEGYAACLGRSRRGRERRRARHAPSDDGFEVATTSETLAGRRTSSSPPAGATSPPCRRMARHLDRTITQVTPSAYRNPDALPDGGVLVVGASATGVQLADELAGAGRDVVLAVGQPHPAAAPLPRHGHLLVARADRHLRPDHRRDADPAAARREPSRAARRPARPPHARPDHAAGRRRRAGRPPHRRRRPPRRASPTTCRHGRAPPTPGCAASSPTSTPTSRPPASRAEVLDPEPHADHRRRSRRSTALDLARPRHRARSSGRPATGAPTRGCTSPCSTPPARSASAAASRPCPASTSLGQRFQHRRNSNFIDGVGRDAALRRRPPRRRLAGTTCARPGP